MAQRIRLCAGQTVGADAFPAASFHSSGRTTFYPDHADSFFVDKLCSCNRSMAAYDKMPPFSAKTSANESYVLHAYFIDNYQY
jgi:hypothetical protein